MNAFTTLSTVAALSFSLFVAHEIVEISSPATIEVAKKKKKSGKNNRAKTKKSTITSKGLLPENELGGPDDDKRMAELVAQGQRALSGVSGQTPGQRAAADNLEAMKKSHAGLAKPPPPKQTEKKKPSKAKKKK